jgi:site-specific recombinase XerD
MTEMTIGSQQSYVTRFLRWYGAKGRPLSEVQVIDIDLYLAEGGATRWCRKSVWNVATALSALCNGLVTVRDAKFFKTRLVPMGPKLIKAIVTYASKRRQLPLPHGEASSFLATRTGNPLVYQNAITLFQRVRRQANIKRESSARYPPRLHDLRHTAAVHRLIAWYKAGADVQRLLPQLATYLGHKDLASTQHYLSMIPELLHEASKRFERYAQPEIRHE